MSNQAFATLPLIGATRTRAASKLATLDRVHGLESYTSQSTLAPFDTTRPPNRISDLPPPFRNGAAHSQNPPDSENGLFVPGSTVPRICGRSENASIRECVFDSGMAHSRTVDHSRNGSASQECSGPSGNGRPILRTIRPFPGSSILG